MGEARKALRAGRVLGLHRERMDGRIDGLVVVVVVASVQVMKEGVKSLAERSKKREGVGRIGNDGEKFCI